MTDALEAEGFVDRHLRAILIVLGGLFMVGAFITMMVAINIFYSKPVRNFVWRDLAGDNICNAAVLTTPSISQARIVDFASDAAVTMNSYDYYNIETVISSALRQYFSSNGQRSYLDALNLSGLPTAVRKSYASLTTYRDGVPNISDEGFLVGRKFWLVEMPLVHFMRTNSRTLKTSTLLQMTIVRVNPSPVNPNGIAIDGVTTKTVADRE